MLGPSHTSILKSEKEVWLPNMNLEVKEVTIQDAEELADWLSSDTWPTFIGDYSSRDEILGKIKDGAYLGEFEKTFWLSLPGELKIGLIEIYDLSELAPMFSIRINTEFRQKGYGRFTLYWLCSYFFENYPEKIRLEAQTREDNIGMRKLLDECYFVLEAYYRSAWPLEDSSRLASVAYGLLKKDWMNKKKSLIKWDQV